MTRRATSCAMRRVWMALISLVTLAGVPVMAHAQASVGSVAVTVRDESGGAIQGVQLVLAGAGIERTLVVDAAGAATFQAVPVGRYELTASRAGFTPSTLRNVVVNDASPLALSVTLRVPGVSAEVQVTGTRGYAETAAATATKTNISSRDVPQAIQVVNRELLDARVTLDFADGVTQNVSSATRSQYDLTGAGLSSAIAIRGFDLGYANNFMRDGIKFPNYGVSEAGDIERIEVLKGPASVLYGRAEPGGIVNLVTKRPLAQPFVDVRLLAGQFGTFRPQVDLSGPLATNGSVRYRLNATYERATTFRDDVDSRRVAVAPVVSWQPNAATLISASGRYLRDRRGTDYGLLAVNGALPDGVPVSRSYSEPFSTSATDGKRIDLALRRTWGSGWGLQSAYHAERLGLSLPRQVFPTFFEDPLAADGRTVKRMALPASFPETWQYADSSLFGQLTTGQLAHSLLVGFEAGYQELRSSYDFYLTFPSTDLLQRTPTLTTADMDRFLSANAPDFIDRSVLRRRTMSVYAQDLISLGGRLKLLVGARFDDFDSTSTDEVAGTVSKDPSRATSPRVGGVYELNRYASLYASYSRSLGRTYPGRLTVNNQAFKAVRGEQVEGGLKLSRDDGRLSGTIALYHLTNDNLPASDPANPGFSIQSGQQRSRGVEIDLAARPARSLDLIATYSHMQPQVSAGDTFAVGNLLPNAARNSGNLWATYTVDGGRLEGFGVGTGVQVVGDRYTSLSNDILLPAFTRTDASLFYGRRTGHGLTYRTQLTIHNVTNRRYLASGTTFGTYVFAGAPRTVMLTVSIARQ